jgi:hypothetical protein
LVSSRQSLTPATSRRDLFGFEVLKSTRDKCDRSGQYRVYRLVQRYGIDAKLFEWSDEITAEYMRSKNLYDQCDVRCPDLPKMA